MLEARQRPALDGDGQDQPTQQIAEVVGDHSEQEAYRYSKAMFWPSIGQVAVGMARPGFDLQLTRYDERGWRATFFHEWGGAPAHERNRDT